MQSLRCCANKKFIILGIVVVVATIQFIIGYNYNVSTIIYRNKISLINSKKDEINEMSINFENLNGPSSYINTSSNTNMTYPRMQKIFLVSSNPRTGSSYAANIITAMPNSAYYYEPFRIASHLSNNRQNYKFISRLLDCEYESIKGNISTTAVRSFLFKKPEMAPNERILLYPYRKLKVFFHSKQKECQETKFRLVKTYELPVSDLIKEMLSQSSVFGRYFKVLYLARDPRGSINSLIQSQELSSNEIFTNVTFTCNRLYRDILAVEEILRNNQIKSRLMVVKYEDFLDQPKNLAKTIYSFLGANNFLSYAIQYIDEHHLNERSLHHYYSDFKNETHLEFSQSINKKSTSSAFGPNSWRDELPRKYLKEITSQKSCLYSMKRFGYL